MSLIGEPKISDRDQRARPYGNDAQVFTFGIHGTVQDPTDPALRAVVAGVSVAAGNTTSGANLWDAGFDWGKRPQLGPDEDLADNPAHGTKERKIAAGMLTQYVLEAVDRKIQEGTLDPNRALVINLVGFSHGGNVGILAADDIAKGLKERGITTGIHLATLSTPAYHWGPENPDEAARKVREQGATLAHTAFATHGDKVVTDLAHGNWNYNTNVTKNYNFNEPYPDSPWPHFDNHGAVINRPDFRSGIAGVIGERFQGFNPYQTARQSTDSFAVAFEPGRPVPPSDVFMPGLPGGKPTPPSDVYMPTLPVEPPNIGSGDFRAQPVLSSGQPVDWATVNGNPLVVSAAAAISRAFPETPGEVSPALAIAVAGAAKQKGFNEIGDVVPGSSAVGGPSGAAAGGQGGPDLLYVTDRRRDDPAANVATVPLTAGNLTPDQAVKQYYPQIAEQPPAPTAQKDPVQVALVDRESGDKRGTGQLVI